MAEIFQLFFLAQRRYPVAGCMGLAGSEKKNTHGVLSKDGEIGVIDSPALLSPSGLCQTSAPAAMTRVRGKWLTMVATDVIMIGCGRSGSHW
jgi:hypothetical protein